MVVLATAAWAVAPSVASAGRANADPQDVDSRSCSVAPALEARGPQGGTEGALGMVARTGSAASVVACTRTGSDVPQWITTEETTYGTVEGCSLYVPTDGQLFVAANASVELLDGPYEVILAAAVDSHTVPEPGTLRYVNVYRADPGMPSEQLGTARPGVITFLRSVQAGYHYISFLAQRYHGPGTVWLRYPSLGVIFIPANGEIRTCQVHGDQTWRTDVSDHLTVVGGSLVQCTISLPSVNGYLFISSDASVGEPGTWLTLPAEGRGRNGITSKAIGPEGAPGCGPSEVNGDYQGYFRVSVDGLDDVNGDRFVNVYNYCTGDDGTDRVVALSVMRQVNSEQRVKPGMDHTVYLAARREAGSAFTLMNVKDPTLSVIFFPDTGVAAHVCASPRPPHPEETDDDYWAHVGSTWAWGSTSFGNIRQCTTSLPAGGWAFISASASAAQAPAYLCDPVDPACGPYRAEFRLGIDTTAGAEDTGRRLDIGDDPGWSTLPAAIAEGSDDAAVITVLKPLIAGRHTFYFVGRRLGPTGGEAFVWYPNLAVLVPNARLFLPITLEP